MKKNLFNGLPRNKKESMSDKHAIAGREYITGNIHNALAKIQVMQWKMEHHARYQPVDRLSISNIEQMLANALEAIHDREKVIAMYGPTESEVAQALSSQGHTLRNIARITGRSPGHIMAILEGRYKQ